MRRRFSVTVTITITITAVATTTTSLTVTTSIASAAATASTTTTASSSATTTSTIHWRWIPFDFVDFSAQIKHFLARLGNGSKIVERHLNHEHAQIHARLSSNNHQRIRGKLVRRFIIARFLLNRAHTSLPLWCFETVGQINHVVLAKNVIHRRVADNLRDIAIVLVIVTVVIATAALTILQIARALVKAKSAAIAIVLILTQQFKFLLFPFLPRPNLHHIRLVSNIFNLHLSPANNLPHLRLWNDHLLAHNLQLISGPLQRRLVLGRNIHTLHLRLNVDDLALALLVHRLNVSTMLPAQIPAQEWMNIEGHLLRLQLFFALLAIAILECLRLFLELQQLHLFDEINGDDILERGQHVLHTNQQQTIALLDIVDVHNLRLHILVRRQQLQQRLVREMLLHPGLELEWHLVLLAMHVAR
mmetsp:Transcript_57231/g.95096  ORF Transcript_57231/g.95096 Transcript_57231/m.95096 type:complete len:418 (-) Transcript_57231:546-1799(-)